MTSTGPTIPGTSTKVPNLGDLSTNGAPFNSFDAERITADVRDQTAASFKQAQQFASIVRDQTIASIKQSQQLFVDSINTWTGVISKMAPQLPSVPGADTLSQTVEAGFDVAQELLAAQRQLIVSTVGAMTASAS